jgi:hypothetical protein
MQKIKPTFALLASPSTGPQLPVVAQLKKEEEGRELCRARAKRRRMAQERK